MGEAGEAFRLSNAAGGRSAGRVFARFSLTRFARDKRGATAIEYGLIVALIAVVIIGSLTALSGTVQSKLYDNVAGALP